MSAEPVTAVIHVDAPPERVFEFFVRPEAIMRWMGETSALEPRPRGRFELDVHGAPVRGEYLAVEPPHRVVLSWGYAGSDRLPPGASTVEVRLIPAAGGTRVELEHRDLPGSELAGHRTGWTHYLARLRIAGAGADPGPDEGMPEPGRSPVRPGH
jgi:uncharacterized protein YndB with AHSA1/START domain